MERRITKQIVDYESTRRTRMTPIEDNSEYLFDSNGRPNKIRTKID